MNSQNKIESFVCRKKNELFHFGLFYFCLVDSNQCMWETHYQSSVFFSFSSYDYSAVVNQSHIKHTQFAQMLQLHKIVIGFSFIGLFSRRVATPLLYNSTASNASTMSTEPATAAPYVPGTNSIVYVTTPNEESAKKIAKAIINQKLAACVNILPHVLSIYEWEGTLNEDSELLLLIKTTTANVDQLTKFVRENHPYSVAEVISVKIENGNPPYLDWVTKSVGTK